MDKAALRADLKVLREELHARDPDAGETLASKFPLKLLERYGPMVAGYVAIGSEIDPAPLMTSLAGEGAELCLPRVEADGSMTYRRWSAGDPLEDRPFGLKEPLESAPPVDPGLILAPLLGFDQRGNRIGYGKGHYDRAVARIRAKQRTFLCGLAFHGQLLEAAPDEEHDQPLDWVVTEQGSIPCFMIRNMRAISESDPGPGAA